MRNELSHNFGLLKSGQQLDEGSDGKVSFFDGGIGEEYIEPVLEGDFFVSAGPSHRSETVLLDHFNVVLVPLILRLLADLVE